MDHRAYEVKALDSLQLAEQAAFRLEQLGYGVDDVSVVTGDRSDPDKHMGRGGIGIGVAAGGLLGLILGGVATGGIAGALVFGPLAAALAGGAAGAGVGGVAGGLMELGLHADDVEEKLHQGGVILTVQLKDPGDRERVRRALDAPLPVQ